MPKLTEQPPSRSVPHSLSFRFPRTEAEEGAEPKPKRFTYKKQTLLYVAATGADCAISALPRHRRLCARISV